MPKKIKLRAGAPRQYHEPTERFVIRAPVADVARWRAAAQALGVRFGVPMDLSKFMRRAANAALGVKS